ncbi:PREDICTED: uncharacterized protein LOC104158616, partial [Cariama cristata]|uniref:uncharacterized protein LOC104158616 n=1 Tax=Cariama cristata TaxID=54380 RepID=UPI000520D90D
MKLAAELRCHCIQTVTGLMLPKHLANVEIIPKGPHCNAVEIIATLKNGQQICLDPQAKWVKMLINRILHRLFICRRKLLGSIGCHNTSGLSYFMAKFDMVLNCRGIESSILTKPKPCTGQLETPAQNNDCTATDRVQAVTKTNDGHDVPAELWLPEQCVQDDGRRRAGRRASLRRGLGASWWLASQRARQPGQANTALPPPPPPPPAGTGSPRTHKGQAQCRLLMRTFRQGRHAVTAAPADTARNAPLKGQTPRGPQSALLSPSSTGEWCRTKVQTMRPFNTSGTHLFFPQYLFRLQQEL